MPWNKLLALLLALNVSVLAQPAPTPATHVAVRFGALHWIDAQGGLPYNRDGRVWVPLKPACNLLGLTCQVQGKNAQVGERQIPMQGDFVELRALVQEPTNFTLTYDNVAKAVVVGTFPGLDMIATPWMQAQADWGNQLHSPYLGPLSVSKTKTAGSTRYTLSTRGALLNELTLLTGLPPGWGANVQSLNVTGALRPSLPDTPNRDASCGGKTECTGTIGREGLWVLAAVDGK